MAFFLKLRDGHGYIRRGLFVSGFFRTTKKQMASPFTEKADAIAFQTQHKLAEQTEIVEGP